MSTHAIESRVGLLPRLPAAARVQIPWIAGGLVGGFLVPFVLADQLGIQKDLYYGLYSAFVIVFLGAWARTTGQPIRELLTRRWRLAVLLGLVAGAVLVLVVMRSDPTSRPAGVALAGAVLWRGVFYGVVDGLLLSAFPILAMFAAFNGTETRNRTGGKVKIATLALALSLTMTAVYHLGYSDFRSAKLRSPVAGDVVWSTPTLLTLNPIGAPIAHAVMHTTAVLHSYHTNLFLPPHR
jgi:hypothetical protein